MSAEYDSELSKLVEAEQIRLLYSALPLSILAIGINAGILAFSQWNVIPHVTIILWVVCLSIVTLARSISLYAYNHFYINGIDNKKWLRYFSIGVFLSGLIWGSSVIWLFPDDEVGHQMLVAFVIGGMSAGATSSLSYHRRYIIMFLSLLLVPLIVRFFVKGDDVSIAMGIMSIAFYIMMSIAGVRNNRNLLHNIKLQIEADRSSCVLRESEDKYRHIFNSSPLGIVHYNLKGNVTDFNMRALELFGVTIENFKNFELLNNITDESLLYSIRRSLLGELSTYEGKTNSIAGKKTTDIRVFCRGIHTDDKSISGGVALLEDISEDKRIKKLKDEFISTISHELRTPLTAIKGAVRLLQEGVVGKVPDSVFDLVRIINVNSERLMHLINDILDINKIESDFVPLDLKPTNIMSLLEEAAATNEVYAKQQGVSIIITSRIDDMFVLADQQRLMQVMYNLLSNAVKFSPVHSTVEISVSLERDVVVVSVVDYGDGIPDDFQSRVFERFTQADSTDSRQVGGSGLGLNISKGIIEKHSGTISFTSSKEGTKFTIRLKQYKSDISMSI